METKTKDDLIKKVNESRVYVSEEEWIKLDTETKIELIALSKMTGEEIQNNLDNDLKKLYDFLVYEDSEDIEYCENCNEDIVQIEIEGEFVCPNCKRGDCIILFDKRK